MTSSVGSISKPMGHVTAATQASAPAAEMLQRSGRLLGHASETPDSRHGWGGSGQGGTGVPYRELPGGQEAPGTHRCMPPDTLQLRGWLAGHSWAGDGRQGACTGQDAKMPARSSSAGHAVSATHTLPLPAHAGFRQPLLK